MRRWKDRHRHAFAVVERDSSILGRFRVRLISTHKTKAAADRALPRPRRGEAYGVFPSFQCDHLPSGSEWTAWKGDGSRRSRRPGGVRAIDYTS